MKNENIKIVLGYIAICLIWGSTWLAIKITLNSFTPIFSTALRFFLASIFIFLFSRLTKVDLSIDKKSFYLYLYLSIFSFSIPFMLVYWGQNQIPTGLASVLFSTYPFFVMIFNSLINRNDKTNAYQIFGTMLAFLGIVVIFSESVFLKVEKLFLVGMFAIMLSAAMQALGAALIKKYGNDLKPLAINFYSISLSFIFVFFSFLIFEDFRNIFFDWSAVLATIYLAFFGTMTTFSIYYWLIKKINLVALSLSAFITPIVAIIFGLVFLNEKASAFFFLGTAMTLSGILIANFPGIRNYLRLKLCKT